MDMQAKRAGWREALELGKAVKASLLRAIVDEGDTPRLAFADYGRHVDSMERLGFVERGLVDGEPAQRLTPQGLRVARALHDVRGALHHGMPWAHHVATPAPNATAAEQKDVWGDKAYQGLTAHGQLAFSNGHLAMLMPRDRRLLPVAHNDPRTFKTIDLAGVWTTSMAGLDTIEPVAVSGLLEGPMGRPFVDDRHVWFSDGSTLRGAYMDAVLRQYPDARFHADPCKARAGMVTITHDGDVVGVVMPTHRGRHLRMPLGVADAMAGYWEGKGYDPRHQTLERAMASKRAELNGMVHRGLLTPAAGPLVLYGKWEGMPGTSYAYPELTWCTPGPTGLRHLEQNSMVLCVANADAAGIAKASAMSPAHLATRWAREAGRARPGYDGGPHVVAVDGYGMESRLASRTEVERYRAERGLPGGFAEDAMATMEEKTKGLWPVASGFTVEPRPYACASEADYRQMVEAAAHQAYGNRLAIPRDPITDVRLAMERDIGVHPAVVAASFARGQGMDTTAPAGMWPLDAPTVGNPSPHTQPAPSRNASPGFGF